MQQTFEINAGPSLPQRIVAELAKFGHRKVKVVIEDVPTDRPSPEELFKQMEEIRLSLQHIKVDPSINLSALANEAHDTPL